MLDVINKGLDFAFDVLSFVRENEERNREVSNRHHNENMISQEKLIAAIQESSKTLSVHIESQIEHVIDKIELEQLEKIKSTIETMKLALELDNKPLIDATLANLLPLSKYSLTRLNEQKQQWFLPWVQSSSICLIALRFSATSESSKHILDRESQCLRLEILNQLKKSLLSQAEVPWVEVSTFVNGTDETLLKYLKFSSFHEDVRFNEGDIIKKYEIKEISKSVVSEILVSKHKNVHADEIIMTLDVESDKVALTYKVRAEYSGTINTVYVKEGDSVENNTLLYSIIKS